VNFTISTDRNLITIVEFQLAVESGSNYYIQESNLKTVLFLQIEAARPSLEIRYVITSFIEVFPEGTGSVEFGSGIEAGTALRKEQQSRNQLVIFDLLNQNNSISRTISDVAITDVCH